MLLLYCMAEAVLEPPQTGVRGAEVISSESRPVCLFSRYEAFELGSPEDLKADALAFYSVVNAALKQATVIPFRFPTLLADEAGLNNFISQHGEGFAAELERLRDTVQMNITFAITAADPDRSSGTAFLASKRDAQNASEQMINKLKQSSPAIEWKQSKPEVMHARISRANAAEFRSSVKAAMPSAHVSGPWPPTAFVNCYPDLLLENK